MPRTHGKMKISAWSDDDFLDLDAEQKVLYIALWSHATTTYAGVVDWRPGRLAKLISPNSTAEDVRRIGAELEARHYVVIDEDTEEVLVRSFVRHDEIVYSPKISVAMVNAFAGVASRGIRRVFIAELHRLQADQPELKGWAEPRVRELLRSHPAVAAPPAAAATPPDGGLATASERTSTMPAEQPGNPSANRSGNPSGKGSGNPSADPSADPSTEGSFEPSGKGFPTSTTTTTTTSTTNVVGAQQRAHAAEPAPPVSLDGGLFPALAGPVEPVTAQTLIGEWIDRCAKRPPERTIGHVAREINNLLAEGIDADDIRRGMATWMDKGLSPSQIPNEVNAAMNARPKLRAVGGGPALYRNPVDPSVYDVPL